MIAYKLFRQMKDGSVAPLFINKKLRLQTGVWYESELHVTKGFKARKGWHCCPKPHAPHLSMNGRVWKKVELSGIIFKEMRPLSQGGEWYLAEKMRVIE
jgi:hypothetical protein